MGDDLLRDDERCREAFRAGERWAMEAVYTAYLPLVQTIVCHGAGGFRGIFDPVLRDDAVQSVFVTAFAERARLAYNGLDPYARFLRGLTQNVCRQLLDKDRRFQRKPEPADEVSADLEADYIAQETATLLRRFKDALGEPDRTILRRYYQEGASEEGLADELGMTRYRTRKVIKALHRQMTQFLRRHGLDV